MKKEQESKENNLDAINSLMGKENEIEIRGTLQVKVA